MNLKQEINRTETEKNKTKQVATNIDNKLVELGGEQAIDLSDVPNKIQEMVKDYRRVAILQPTQSYTIKWNQINIPVFRNITIPLGLNFKPSKIVAHLKFTDTEYQGNVKTVVVFSEKQNLNFNSSDISSIVGVAHSQNTAFTIPKANITKDSFALRTGIENGGARTFVVDYIMAIE